MKKEEYYEKKKIKSKKIVSNISNSLKLIDRRIIELDRSKKKTDGLIKKFDISCYDYNLVEEMSCSKNRLEKNIKNILDKLNVINIKDKDRMDTSIKKVDYINDILSNSEIQLKSVEKEHLNDVEKLQMNAIKKGIYDKFILMKSSIDREKLVSMYEKRKSKKAYIQKFIDRFFVNDEKVDEKKENLYMQIHEIDEVRKDISQNNIPCKEYKIVEIMADIELYLMDNQYEKKYEDKIQNIKDLRDSITSIFSIDKKELRKEIARKRQIRLPVKIDKKLSTAEKNKQKVIAFLTNNGYIKGNANEENALHSRMANVIRKINFISESIEKILKS